MKTENIEIVKENVSHTPGDSITKNRHKYLGGSDLPALFNTGSFKDYVTLVREKAGVILVEFKGNEYTRYGQLLEPQIRDYINSVYELNFKEKTNIDEKLRLRSNCDGLDVDAGILLEIKTNNGEKKTYDDVFDYVLQMQLYMMQFNVKKGYLVQYARPETFYKGLDYVTQHSDDFFDLSFDPKRITVMEIAKDEKLINEILKKAEKFWNDVERVQANPGMSNEEIYFSTEITEYKKTVAELNKLEVQVAALKDLEKITKEKRNELYTLMEKYNVKSLVTDKLLITRVLPTTTSSLDTTKLKKELPEIVEKYTKVGSKKGFLTIKVKQIDSSKKIKDVTNMLKDAPDSKKTEAIAALGL